MRIPSTSTRRVRATGVTLASTAGRFHVVIECAFGELSCLDHQVDRASAHLGGGSAMAGRIVDVRHRKASRGNLD